jgi:hypothetical protein
MYYGARYYLPGLGRFISADTIVPDQIKPQALDRYSYGLNNPVKYLDPTGHNADCGMGDPNCQGGQYCDEVCKVQKELEGYGVHVNGLDTYESAADRLQALNTIYQSVTSIAQKLLSQSEFAGYTLSGAFEKVFGDSSTITILKDATSQNASDPTHCGQYHACNNAVIDPTTGQAVAGVLGKGANIIIDPTALTSQTLIHEFAHTFTNPSASIPGVSSQQQFNGKPQVFDFAHLFNGSIDNASDYAFKNDLNKTGLTSHAGAWGSSNAELSADMFALWVLNVDDAKVREYGEGIAAFCASQSGNACGY